MSTLRHDTCQALLELSIQQESEFLHVLLHGKRMRIRKIHELTIPTGPDVNAMYIAYSQKVDPRFRPTLAQWDESHIELTCEVEMHDGKEDPVLTAGEIDVGWWHAQGLKLRFLPESLLILEEVILT